ncbi:MAG TPA: ROK family protein [Verrucomicrobiae bacterium]|jgi:glucokinase|nr:ROK family protein [Verrucomicrobiae bacterium]
MRERAVIGVDIGGTKTLCALINERFKLRQYFKFKTSPPDGRPKFMQELGNSIEMLKRRAAREHLEVVGIGLACAGKVDSETGKIINAPNVLWLEGFQIGRALKRATGLNSVMGNDVQLALEAEHQLGVAVGCSNVLGVFFGTGVGGAALFNGKLYRGASGAGGQVGGILAHSLGGADTPESHGTLDRIASKAAIAGAALGMGLKQWAPHLYREVGSDLSKVTWGALARARKKGDRHIEDLVRSRIRVAAITLSSIINFMNPEMLVLGGGLTEELPQLVRSETEVGLRDYLEPEVKAALKIKTAQFGNRAGAIGAASLALKKFS